MKAVLCSTKSSSPFSPLPTQYIKHPLISSLEVRNMGCLILAGGEGTRLKTKKPKGCISLPWPGNPTLFQVLLEEIRSLKKNLPVAIMTSRLNHLPIADYLTQKKYFGLDKKQISLFTQDLLPVCDQKGNQVYNEEKEKVEAPAGNGQALSLFYQSGIWQEWHRKGIEIVQVIFIDNPLSHPFDKELFTLHQKENYDLVVRCTKREKEKEQMGLVGIEKGKLAIREYTELPKNFSLSTFPLSYTGIFSCTMQFIAKIHNVTLPWHFAQKKGKGIVQVKKKWYPVDSVLKLETFLFDLFPLASSFCALLSNREHYFAPVKRKKDLYYLQTIKPKKRWL